MDDDVQSLSWLWDTIIFKRGIIHFIFIYVLKSAWVRVVYKFLPPPLEICILQTLARLGVAHKLSSDSCS